MKTKAVVFDAYGTWFDVNSAAERCKDKIGAKWETFANFWRTTQLEYTWLRSLMKRHKNFWDITEDSLDKSMKVFNINKNIKEKGFVLFTHRIDLWEKQDFLSILKRHQKSLKINKISRPVNYLPLNNDFKNIIKIKIVLLQKY